ncbi:MAG TPA: ABC transporter permease [Terriglobia bacterium]|nr:ABC transporter permease [Terriglobia bacterium]
MLHDLIYRLRALLRRDSMEAELDKELRAHVEQQAEKYVQAGMSPEEAARRARLEFGGIEQVKEDCRESWGVRIVSELAQDLRYGARQLRRNPGFTTVAVLTLALGIGANTAMFSFLDAVVMRVLPYPQPGELVAIYQQRRGGGTESTQVPLSALNVVDLQKDSQGFQEISYYHWERPFLGTPKSAEYLVGAAISPEFLKLLGVDPILGRAFAPSEFEPGNDRVALLGYDFWQRQFGGRRDIIGQTIQMDGKPYTVLGVMPKGFYFVMDVDTNVLTPLALSSEDLSERERSSHTLSVVGRLSPGVTLASAQAEMDSAAVRLAKQYPSANQGWGLKVRSLLSTYYRQSVPESLLAIAAATLLVLLIGCVNVANLLLARSSVRQKEIAVRAALGAGRKRIVRQLLMESLLLALAGGLAGIFVGWIGVDLLALAANHYPVPGRQGIALNDSAFIFCLSLSVITAVIFGLVPSLRATKVDLNGSLKEAAAAVTTTAGRSKVGGRFIVAEIALAVALVTAAGLLIRTSTNLLNADLGFDPDHVLTFDTAFPPYKYKTGIQESEHVEEILARLRALPGVTDAAGFIPGGRLVFRQEGQPPPAPGQEPSADAEAVLPGFMHTLRATLIAGRELTQADTASAPPVAIVNESFARVYFPNVNPVRRQIVPLSQIYGYENPNAPPQPILIVGVIKDIFLRGPVLSKGPRIYLPYSQYPAQHGMIFVLRTAVQPMSLVPTVRAAVRSVDSEVALLGFDRMRHDVASWEHVWLPMTAVSIFAGLALLLSAVGISGVISYSVAQRTHEIGIRMALGAERRDVLRMVIGQGLRLALIGVAFGVAGALALTRFLASLLYGVTPTDPVTFIAVSLILIAVALAACYIPARRAANVDPMTALRHE